MANKRAQPTRYGFLGEIVADCAEGLRPPEDFTVDEWAEKNRYLNTPGAFVGPWDNDVVPYMVEFMQTLTSIKFQAAIFVGPAQSAKTDCVFNWIGHTVDTDPSDMLIVHMDEKNAREFSKIRINRFHRWTRAVGAKLVPRKEADSIYTKLYRSGMYLSMAWPTVNQLSSRAFRYVWITDIDRMPLDVDGEGAVFDLARKRTTTFRRYAMTVAESSPGYNIEQRDWMPRSRHEAPPVQGILALYNRGDRRRYYWQCQHCQEWFEPDFHLLVPGTDPDPSEAAKSTVMVCPFCGGVHTHADKRELNLGGVWLRDGETIDKDGNRGGTPAYSNIASFWLKGVCAAFASWSDLMLKYLQAVAEYESTGSEIALKTTVNTDQGLPYVPKQLAVQRLPENLKARAEDLGERVVPRETRFLTACVDVQKHSFRVQVQGTGVAGDKWIIDSFEIRKSNRTDADGDREWISPGAYLEDWDLLIDQVIRKEYPLSDGSGRTMAIKMTACDSGGREGVTAKAYDFWRKLRGVDGQLQSRFLLVKGDGTAASPRIQLTYPDSERKDRHAGARGDVPVLRINTDLVKDGIDKQLDRVTPGGGMIHFPMWLPDSVYSELTVETKNAKGKWENTRRQRNEAWDHLVYDAALCLTRWIALEHIDWDAPPSWAAEWDDNSMVRQVGKPRVENRNSSRLAKIASQLA